MGWLQALHSAALRSLGYTIGSGAEVFDGEVYAAWRQTRVNTLVAVLGPGWFHGKAVLELAAGHGGVGLALANLGAAVTVADGRAASVDELRQRIGDQCRVLLLDNDRPWADRFPPQSFDLVIHWGLLYHLRHWRRDLTTALRVGARVCLESAVLSVDGMEREQQRREYGSDQALHGTGTYVTAHTIETLLRGYGATFTRYDDPSLNAGPYHYDWHPTEAIETVGDHRRFWMICSPTHPMTPRQPTDVPRAPRISPTRS